MKDTHVLPSKEVTASPGEDAVGWAERVRRREVSPAELVREAVARLDAAVDLNAVVHRFDAEAFLQRLPEDGPLRGVPFLLKDELDLAGYPVTYGSRLLAGLRPTRTHPVIQRFLDAGLVPLGRTNMSEVGLLPTTEPHAFGPTHNPWKRGYSPGGSSGGSAAAVAAGVVPLAQAGDGGGSIRIPASACGLVGLKPSRGRHPAAMDDPPFGFVVHLGLSTTVRDTAALLDVTSAGIDGLPRPEGGFLEDHRRDPSPLRVGLTTRDFFGRPFHREVETAVERVAERLEGLGHRVERVLPPFETETFAAAFRVLWAAAAAVFLKRVEQEAPVPAWLRPVTRRPWVFRTLVGLPVGPALTERFTRRLATMDARHAPSDLWLAEQVMHTARASVDAFFAERDLWLTATLPAPPGRIGSLSVDGTEDELQARLFGAVAYTPVANATGHPALSLPAGSSEEGLPLGAHFMAPLGREDRLLRVASQLERAHPWPRRAPH
jgi:amidase